MSPHSRRKSIDSSSSSSSSSSDSDSSSRKHHQRKVKKDKSHKKDKDQHRGSVFPTIPQLTPQMHGFNESNQYGGQAPISSPPSYSAQSTAPPPSGYRIALTTTSAFPNQQQIGQAPCYDLDGVSPVYLGSALFDKSVHPCKIAPHLNPPCAVAYAGAELNHHGRYDLLPFDPTTMEFVHASHGRIPHGRRPVEGGYEENGTKLYHAVGVVSGIRVPGKTGEHLYVYHLVVDV